MFLIAVLSSEIASHSQALIVSFSFNQLCVARKMFRFSAPCLQCVTRCDAIPNNDVKTFQQVSRFLMLTTCLTRSVLSPEYSRCSKIAQSHQIPFNG